jgi:hypothetical protein
LSTPEQIQREIEGTRRNLSSDVDRLAEKVSPGRVVSRRVERVKSGATSLKERIMGSAPDPDQVKDRASSAAHSAADSVSGAAESARDAVTGAAESARDAVANAPQVVRQQAQGNPLAAGLVAFGVGMIVASMIPASEREKQLAASAEEAAREPLQQKAAEVAGELRESATESVQQVKETATSAASDTVDQAKEQARTAAENIGPS